jgi:peptide deformylase
MFASPSCVGVAAPQIGVSLRAFSVDVTGHKKADSCHGPFVLFNPVLVLARHQELAREGCLSVPDLTGNVARATEVVVRGLTAEGTMTVIEANAFEARALLHELDHLDGLLFLDRVGSVSTDVFRRKRYR